MIHDRQPADSSRQTGSNPHWWWQQGSVVLGTAEQTPLAILHLRSSSPHLVSDSEAFDPLPFYHSLAPLALPSRSTMLRATSALLDQLPTARERNYERVT